MEISRTRFMILPAIILVAAVIYWFWSYEPAGSVMLVVFATAIGLLGFILIPTLPNVGPTAPVEELPDPEAPVEWQEGQRDPGAGAPAGPSAGAIAEAGERPDGETATTTSAASATLEVELRIQRYNPETDDEPHWEHYVVPAAQSDRVLDLLHQVKWYIDGTLTFRRSCAHGVCGSDAMMINGRNRLACEYLVKDAGSMITVEPMRGIPIIKDLLVDMDPFWAKYKSVMPFLVADEVPVDGRERRQAPEDRERYDDTTKCIACAACTTACPSFWSNDKFVGPAAIVNAHRYIFDSRDEGTQERLEILADADGVWRCRTIFNCVDACPRGINITRAILEVTQEIQSQRIA